MYRLQTRAKIEIEEGGTVLQFNPIFDCCLIAFFLLLFAFFVKWLVEAKLNR